MMVVEQPADEPRRKRSSSVQRMLELERKLKMERLKTRAPGVKPRPVLLTDPPSIRESPTNTPSSPLPGASPADHGDSAHTEAEGVRSDQPTVSYSARARESMGTTAASRKALAFARASEETSSLATPSICPSPTWEVHDRHRTEKGARLRLAKPPPSASRTPQLWAKTSVPMSTPPTEYQRFETFGPPPPPPPPKDEKPSKPRKRSDSLGSITSVSSSLTSKIRSLDMPRGRATARDSGMSFLDGLKPRWQKEADYEWHGRRLEPHNPTTYSVPARHMYRPPAGSRLSRQQSRSSSCSIASSDNLANPPALTFPSNQRHRGPPVKLRTPRPISRSRSGSLSGSPTGEHHGSLSRASSLGPSGSRNPSRNEVNDMVTEARVRSYYEEVGLGGRSSRASSVPCPRRDTFGNYPDNENNPAAMSTLNGREYPPSASASAFAYLANLDDEPAEPPRRRRSSLIGRLRGRQPGGSEDSRASDTPSQYSEDMPRSPSATRHLKDAAKAAFRRSTSRASSFRRRSNASDVSPAETVTRGVTSPFPDLVGANQASNPSSPTAPGSHGSTVDRASGPGPLVENHTLRDTPEVLHRPRPIVDPNTMRPWDHSSISSYETSQSRHQSSTLTPNTSRPQSEKGIVSAVGPGDDQKVLGGYDKPPLAPSVMPGTGFAVQTMSTPPVRRKSSKRALRVNVGTEVNSSSPKSPNAPVTPTKSSSSTTPTSSAAVKGGRMRPEGESRTKKVQSPVRLDTGGAQVSRPSQQPRNQASPLDSSMLPKPLNVSPQTNESMDSAIPHKLRRQAKSQHLVSDDAASSNGQTSEGTPTSHASSPREKQSSPVSHAEVASNGDASTLQMKSTLPKERQQRVSIQGGPEAEPLSKILVRCCGCGYFHDVPHRIYDRMTAELEESLEEKEERSGQKGKHVRCPWCRHVLGVKCCAGYVALVQLKERLH